VFIHTDSLDRAGKRWIWAVTLHWGVFVSLQDEEQYDGLTDAGRW